jgi:hypothetical protein
VSILRIMVDFDGCLAGDVRINLFTRQYHIEGKLFEHICEKITLHLQLNPHCHNIQVASFSNRQDLEADNRNTQSHGGISSFQAIEALTDQLRGTFPALRILIDTYLLGDAANDKSQHETWRHAMWQIMNKPFPFGKKSEPACPGSPTSFEAPGAAPDPLADGWEELPQLPAIEPIMDEYKSLLFLTQAHRACAAASHGEPVHAIIYDDREDILANLFKVFSIGPYNSDLPRNFSFELFAYNNSMPQEEYDRERASGAIPFALPCYEAGGYPEQYPYTFFGEPAGSRNGTIPICFTKGETITCTPDHLARYDPNSRRLLFQSCYIKSHTVYGTGSLKNWNVFYKHLSPIISTVINDAEFLEKTYLEKITTTTKAIHLSFETLPPFAGWALGLQQQPFPSHANIGGAGAAIFRLGLQQDTRSPVTT